jgi:ribonuclease HI
MSDTIRIWIEVSHHAAFRSGGWAFVRAEGRALAGAAGGERTGSPERIAIAGLLAALQDLPPVADVEVHSTARVIAAAARRVAEVEAGAEAPADDLDLWARLSTALKTHRVGFAATASQPRTPTAFAAAWAELARDKAKTTPFRATIPKVNLAKAGVPAPI